MSMRNIGLRLCEATVDPRVSDVNPAESEPFRVEIHPWRGGEVMGNHVAGHNEKQDEHDDDRTGFGGSEQ